MNIRVPLSKIAVLVLLVCIIKHAVSAEVADTQPDPSETLEERCWSWLVTGAARNVATSSAKPSIVLVLHVFCTYIFVYVLCVYYITTCALQRSNVPSRMFSIQLYV